MGNFPINALFVFVLDEQKSVLGLAFAAIFHPLDLLRLKKDCSLKFHYDLSLGVMSQSFDFKFNEIVIWPYLAFQRRADKWVGPSPKIFVRTLSQYFPAYRRWPQYPHVDPVKPQSTANQMPSCS